MVRQFNVRLRSLRGVTVIVPVLVAMTTALAACGGDSSGPQPLGVVTDLSATAVDAFQVDLTWSSARGAGSYAVHRSTEAGFIPSIATRIATGLAANAVSYSDGSVIDNTQYYYKVRARKDSEATLSNQASATTPATQPELLVSDKFDRVVDPGWGTADVGGAWNKADEGPMMVNGAIGMIETMDSIPQINVLTESSTYGRYVDGKIRFKINKVADAGFHTVEVYARRDGTVGDNQYRFSVMAHRDSVMALRLEKEVGAVSYFLTDPVPTTLTFEPGAWYWVRWVATGTQPTNLRLRIWRLGDTEPTTWNIDVEHHEPALDVRGTTGVRVHAAANHIDFPVVFSFDDLTLDGD